MSSTTLRQGTVVAALVTVGALGFWWTRASHAEPKTVTAAKAEATAVVASDVEAREAALAAKHEEARRARDAMRADILAAIKRRAAEAAPAKTAAPATTSRPKEAAAEGDEAPPHGKYDPEYIRSHMRKEMFPLLQSCYNGALKRRPALAGRVVMKFTIAGDPDVGGIVENAEIGDESDIKDADMETCVRESLMTITFDKPPSGGGIVTVTYPVLFSPGDDDEADGGGGGQ